MITKLQQSTPNKKNHRTYSKIKRQRSKNYLRYFSDNIFKPLFLDQLKTFKEFEDQKKENTMWTKFQKNFLASNPYGYIYDRDYWLNLKEKENSSLQNNTNKEKTSLFFKRKYIIDTPILLDTTNFSREEKLKLELRKQYQAYMYMNYYLSSYSYFDYFSQTALDKIIRSKIIGQEYYRDDLTHELLYSSFFSTIFPETISKRKIWKSLKSLDFILRSHDLRSFFIQNKIDEFQNFGNNNVEFYITKVIKPILPLVAVVNLSFFLTEIILDLVPNKPTILKKIQTIFHKSSNKLDDLEFKNQLGRYEIVQFSDDLTHLFEKAVKNAKNRFKTPIINAPILFITLMELKHSKVTQILKKSVVDKIEWELLRYRLIRELHNEEVSIRFDITDKNQRFFGYLLKSQLEDDEFTRLVDENTIGKVTAFFRNKLMVSVMDMDLGINMRRDILKSSQFKGFQRLRSNLTKKNKRQSLQSKS